MVRISKREQQHEQQQVNQKVEAILAEYERTEIKGSPARRKSGDSYRPAPPKIDFLIKTDAAGNRYGAHIDDIDRKILKSVRKSVERETAPGQHLSVSKYKAKLAHLYSNKPVLASVRGFLTFLNTQDDVLKGSKLLNLPKGAVRQGLRQALKGNRPVSTGARVELRTTPRWQASKTGSVSAPPEISGFGSSPKLNRFSEFGTIKLSDAKSDSSEIAKSEGKASPRRQKPFHPTDNPNVALNLRRRS